jgi:aldose 1-epimerase
MNAVRRRSEPLERPRRPSFTSSGRFTPTLIALLCVLLLAISWERGRGNFHRLTSAVLQDNAGNASQALTGPGGQPAIHLIRTPDAVDSSPEFISATLLPGRGLNVLQLTAMVPGRGEIPLLVSPPLEDVDQMLTGNGPDANGALSTTMGGAFMVPWSDRLAGKPSQTPGVLQTLWLGQRLTFPASAPNSLLSTRGLLLNRSADTTHSDVILDGQSVDATFHPGTFSGNWASTGSVHIQLQMTAKRVIISVTVQNTGETPMPVGIGWLPYFNIASHDRSKATLTLPSSTRLETESSTGLPTGRMVGVAGTPLDFVSARGTRLGALTINDTYVHLTTPVLSDSPIAELRDTAYGYGIRMMPLTSNIRALRVIAPPDKPWVVISPETNFDDPLGPQWNTSEGSGISTLQPGASLQWKVALEVFTFTAGSTSPGI